MVIETRPLGPLSREIVSTIPDGVEPLDQGQGLTHRADIGIGSKVTSPIILQVPCHEDPGEWLLYGNLDIGIPLVIPMLDIEPGDRKSTRLNSSHVAISYAVFCLKKKNNV